MVRFIILTCLLSKTLLCHYLHSNMVRFIIRNETRQPSILVNLHSNMVRFIIRASVDSRNQRDGIYIPIWLDLL